jgi:hypothetical protein
MKNSNDTIGNRTRELPACSAVPQPTAPPRAPRNKKKKNKGKEFTRKEQQKMLQVTGEAA